MFEQHRVYGIERDSPEFRKMVDHRTWCPTNDGARRVWTTGWNDTCRWVLTFSVEIGGEDRCFQARVSIPLVGRKERGDVVQRFSGTRGGWDNGAFDFSGGVSKYVVNGCGITVEDEPGHVDYAFPFTREC